MSSDADAGSRQFSVLQAARVLATLEAVAKASAFAESSERTAGVSAARQQSELEALQDAARKLDARSRDVRNSLQFLRESVDRAKLAALNAALEGARIGDPAGKALVVLGDEVRNLLARALDALDEHTSLLAEIDRERDRSLSELSTLSEEARKLGDTLRHAQEQSRLAKALVGELRIDLGDILGTDPEAARLLADSALQVRSLAGSLGELARRAPVAPDALRELLAPLLALLSAAPGEP